MNIFTFFRANLLSGLKPATRFAALLIAVFLLAACGGAGSGDSASGGGNVSDGGDASGDGGASDPTAVFCVTNQCSPTAITSLPYNISDSVSVGESDWYSFTLSSTQIVEVVVNGSTADLYDFNGGFRGGLSNYYLGYNKIEVPLPAGTYYLVASHYSASSAEGDYYLSISASSIESKITDITSFPHEAEYAISYGGYSDWFSFTLDSEQTVDINVSSSEYFWTVYLYNSAGIFQLADRTDLSVIQQFPADTYYLRVYGMNSDAGSYRLGINSPVSLPSHQALTLPHRSSPSVSNTRVDRYDFTLSEASIINISVTFSYFAELEASDYLANVRLYSPSSGLGLGFPIGSGGGGGGGGGVGGSSSDAIYSGTLKLYNINYQNIYPLLAGDYYIQVDYQNVPDTLNDYQLSVDAIIPTSIPSIPYSDQHTMHGGIAAGDWFVFTLDSPQTLDIYSTSASGQLSSALFGNDYDSFRENGLSGVGLPFYPANYSIRIAGDYSYPSRDFGLLNNSLNAGTYYLQVRGDNQGANYTLNINQADPNRALNYPVPATPTGFYGAVVNGSISLNWDDVVGATYYTIDRTGRSPGFRSTVSSYTDYEVSSGGKTYRVVACNSAGCSTPATVTVAYFVDTDSDGVLDDFDNCRLINNPNQEDGDIDNVGDLCDVDVDGDGLIELSTAAQLNMMRNNLGGTGLDADNSDNDNATGGNSIGCGNGSSITTCNGYEQMADISLASFTNWDPIGSCSSNSGTFSSTGFTGVFEGNGNTISDLTITTIGDDFCFGLFASIVDGIMLSESGNILGVSKAGELRNVNLRDIVIRKSDNLNSNIVGGLVGMAMFTRIVNSSVTDGSISGSFNVGGLAGWATNSTILDSSAQLDTIRSRGQSGGLVGFADGTVIRGSSATINNIIADPTSEEDSGGLGGLAGYAHYAEISFSYAIVNNIDGTDTYIVGGLIGGAEGASIDSSYAIVDSIRVNDAIGGLVGSAESARISSSYALTGELNSTYELLGSASVDGLTDSFTSTIVSASYWWTGVDYNLPNGVTRQASVSSTGGNKTRDELQVVPNSDLGIYATWIAQCNNVNAWDFGTNNELPALSCFGADSLLRQREAQSDFFARNPE